MASRVNPNPDELLAFARHKLNTFAKWDVARFFHDNPHTEDTAENIARYVGRELREVGADLDALVNDAVLKAWVVSGVRLYRLAEDDALRQQLHDFLSACDDGDFRESAVQQVIHGTRA